MASQVQPPTAGTHDGKVSTPEAYSKIKAEIGQDQHQQLEFSSQVQETSREKFFRKIKNEPLVPIGSLLTCGALIVASNHLRTGNRAKFNQALRWRVGFQAMTLVAALAGTYYYGQKSSSNQTTPAAGTGTSSDSSRDQSSWQQTRNEERALKEKVEFAKRLAEAKGRAERDEDKALEEALLGKEQIPPPPPPPQPTSSSSEEKVRKARPVIGKDTRTF